MILTEFKLQLLFSQCVVGLSLCQRSSLAIWESLQLWVLDTATVEPLVVADRTVPVLLPRHPHRRRKKMNVPAACLSICRSKSCAVVMGIRSCLEKW